MSGWKGVPSTAMALAVFSKTAERQLNSVLLLATVLTGKQIGRGYCPANEAPMVPAVQARTVLSAHRR